MLPPLQAPGTVGSILSTTLLAVFAFIGFESLANVAEEVEDPPHTIPWAIFLTLVLSTLLYMLVVWIALLAVPVPELIHSSAPLALVFERLTGLSPRFMSAIAIVATLNGIVIQVILASRVLYGLSRQGQLPAVFAEVNPKTRTPLFANDHHGNARPSLRLVYTAPQLGGPDRAPHPHRFCGREPLARSHQAAGRSTPGGGLRGAHLGAMGGLRNMHRAAHRGACPRDEPVALGLDDQWPLHIEAARLKPAKHVLGLAKDSPRCIPNHAAWVMDGSPARGNP